LTPCSKGIDKFLLFQTRRSISNLLARSESWPLMQPWHISAPSIPDLQQLRQFDIPLLGEKDLRNLLLRPDIVERRRSLKRFVEFGGYSWGDVWGKDKGGQESHRILDHFPLFTWGNRH